MSDNLRIQSEEENWPDGTLIFSLIVPSSPATKKNSNRIIRNKGFLMVIPSKRFMDYQKYCQTFFEPLRNDKGLLPIDFGVTVKIRAATDKWIVPDYNNICQALGDILQHYGVMADDKWIHWTDGEVENNIPKEHWFLGVDKENPRLEIEIRRFRHPLEEYRKDKEAKELAKAERSKNKKK